MNWRNVAQHMNWRNIVVSVLPTVLPLIPGLPPTLVPIIVHGIVEAEETLTNGAEKKAHVVGLVQRGIDGANAAGIAPAIDLEAVRPVVERAIDKGVRVANLVAEDAR